MRLQIACKRNPNVQLLAYIPTGRRYLIIQQADKLPQDGIPLSCLPELVTILTHYHELVMQAPPDVYMTPFSWAEKQLTRKVSEDFTPFLVPDRDDSAFFILPISHCANCDTIMYGSATHGVPSIDVQLKRAQWHRASGVSSPAHGGYLCQPCSVIASFKCHLCGEIRPMGEVKARIGDPPDFLCTTCFETVTAREWHEAVEKLNNEHRYDYE